jgi:mono/diheme cytochrome c family protein
MKTTQSKRTLHTIALLAIVASMSTLSACRGWESSEPPIHLNPNMDTQHKLKPYRASAFFSDGRAMRMPIEGTVPRTLQGLAQRDTDFIAADPHFYQGLVDGKSALAAPASVKPDAATLARGQKTYGIYCAPCHGIGGDGAGTVAKRYPIPPPSFLQDRLYNMPLGDVYNAITHGKNVPNMPSYATQIAPSDRWAVVLYTRSLMMKANPDVGYEVDPSKLAADPSTLKGDPVAMGQAIHNKVCIACHSLDGTRLVGPTFKSLYGRRGKLADGSDYVADDAYIKESILEPMKKVVADYPPAMPPQMLADDEIAAIIAFMKSL